MADDLTPDPEATAAIRGAMPLCAALGIEALAFAPDDVRLVMAWHPDRCTSGGLLHGGAVMALADSAGAAVAALNLPEGAAGTSTIDSSTNFLGGVREGSVVATAVPLHVGGTTIVVETEVRQGERLVAKVTQTQIVLRPRS